MRYGFVVLWLGCFVFFSASYFLVVWPFEHYSYLVKSERIDRYLNTFAGFVRNGLFMTAVSAFVFLLY